MYCNEFRGKYTSITKNTIVAIIIDSIVIIVIIILETNLSFILAAGIPGVLIDIMDHYEEVSHTYMYVCMYYMGHTCFIGTGI